MKEDGRWTRDDERETMDEGRWMMDDPSGTGTIPLPCPFSFGHNKS